ncbi:MAG TPA: hypothetical protein VLZ30_09000 [Verrucomicrobiae bacterium]|nr:hypothetical protein [Verrucomicrobiae bacterium]
MNKRSRILAVVVVLAIVGVGIGLLALFRIQQAREFSEPHQMRRGGTNSVVRLVEADIGKTDVGYILIVYMRLENPNPFDIALPREWFELVDRRGKHYAPSVSGTQRELIKLPANGVLPREMLSFTIPDDSLEGMLVLVAGQNYKIWVKDRTPFNGRLRDGEFRSFRRQSW